MSIGRPSPSLPTFVDFEASSLGNASYPIEVAWNIGEEIESHLIAPCAGWTDWNRDAEAIHGIPRDELVASGKPAGFVVARMQAALGGRLVLSDNPDYDWFWCKRLFDAADTDPEFAFADTNRSYPPEVAALPDFAPRLEAWKVDARTAVGHRHRAAPDVAFWVLLWRIIAEDYAELSRSR